MYKSRAVLCSVHLLRELKYVQKPLISVLVATLKALEMC